MSFPLFRLIALLYNTVVANQFWDLPPIDKPCLINWGRTPRKGSVARKMESPIEATGESWILGTCVSTACRYALIYVYKYSIVGMCLGCMQCMSILTWVLAFWGMTFCSYMCKHAYTVQCTRFDIHVVIMVIPFCDIGDTHSGGDNLITMVITMIPVRMNTTATTTTTLSIAIISWICLSLSLLLLPLV